MTILASCWRTGGIPSWRPRGTWETCPALWSGPKTSIFEAISACRIISSIKEAGMKRSMPSPILPMAPEHAAQIAAWRYPGEYALYNWPEGEPPCNLLDSGSYVLLNQTGGLVGFYQFGAEARIPTEGASPYLPGFLDMGLGLRPDLCGLGLGKSFVLAGMDFAQSRLRAESLRLTVAAFNLRARKVYERCGFVAVGEAVHRKEHTPFWILTWQNAACRASR
ncbi:N-acetyltransferase [Acutalibacter sp. 1XD8-33]|nr:N-acetyltransferase [Acutalibacter sp. 1XD8-33]